MSCTRRGVKTEHLVARTFRQCRALDRTLKHAHACGSSSRTNMAGRDARLLRSRPLRQHVSSTAPRRA